MLGVIIFLIILAIALMLGVVITVNKCFAGIVVDRHDRRMTKKSAKLCVVANSLSDNRDQTYSW